MYEKVISGIIDAEIERLTQIKKMLTSGGAVTELSLLSSSGLKLPVIPPAPDGKRGKDRLSPEGRKAIQKAVKKRWAKKGKSAAPAKATKKGKSAAPAKASGIKNYWASMTDAERAKEMRRRMKLSATKAKQATA